SQEWLLQLLLKNSPLFLSHPKERQVLHHLLHPLLLLGLLPLRPLYDPHRKCTFSWLCVCSPAARSAEATAQPPAPPPAGMSLSLCLSLSRWPSCSSPSLSSYSRCRSPSLSLLSLTSLLLYCAD